MGTIITPVLATFPILISFHELLTIPCDHNFSSVPPPHTIILTSPFRVRTPPLMEHICSFHVSMSSPLHFILGTIIHRITYYAYNFTNIFRRYQASKLTFPVVPGIPWKSSSTDVSFDQLRPLGLARIRSSSLSSHSLVFMGTNFHPYGTYCLSYTHRTSWVHPPTTRSRS